MRQARLSTKMPSILWQIMVAGVGVCLSMKWLFDATTRALSGVSAFSLGAVIGMIALLDNPFLGDLSVTPDACELVYNQFMRGP